VRVSFTLSEAASVRLRVERRRARSARYVTLRGGFTVAGRQGANRLRFTGRLAGRALSAGRYRLRAVARDGAGNASRARRTPFRIAVRRAARSRSRR
jgi:hypothetical protein